MKKKVIKKSEKKIPSIASYHMVYYVEDGTPAMRKFNTLEDMETFFKEFQSRYPEGCEYEGYYLDFCVTNIYGEITFL
jgi:hypothetical protein